MCAQLGLLLALAQRRLALALPLRGVLGLCPPPSSFTQGPLRPGHSLWPVSLARGLAPLPQIRKAWLPQEEALDASQHIWRS